MAQMEIPLEEAVKELTGFEVIELEKHYKTTMENLGGTRLLIGTVHAFENRNGNAPVTWQQTEAMTIRQLTEYFPDSEPDVDSEQGKESNDSTTEPES